MPIVLRWVVLVLIGSLFSTSAVFAKPAQSENQVIVRFAKDLNLSEARQLVNGQNFEIVEALVPDLNIYLVRLKGNMKVNQALSMMNVKDDIAYAQPDQEVKMRETLPNDAEFEKQWNMHNKDTKADIRAPLAWDLGTGGKDREGNDIVAAIVDGGMDILHKKIAPNLYVNLNEIPGNGIDDDGNGYIDDVNGWNAFAQSGSIPKDRHGTHVAGIAGAFGNTGEQVTGVNWRVKLMPVAGSSGNTSIVLRAYGYVLKQKKLWLETNGRKGANIVVTNSSFGVDEKKCDTGEYPAWNDTYSAMGDVGILSAAATANLNVDVDVKGDIPTGCTSPYIIKVTNTDKNDRKFSSAAFGKTMVELAAPGTGVLSLLPDNRTGSLTGTSMSTPHVAGAVAFLHSVASVDFANLNKREPGRAALVLKNILLNSVDKLDSLKDITVTGGRLNLAAAAQAINNYRERR